MEDEAFSLGFNEMSQDEARPQRRMAAEVDFTARRKPAKLVSLPFLYGKGRFRQIIFNGNGLHQRIGQPGVQNPGAIGYVALPYLLNNDSVGVVSIDGVEPTLENTYNGKYSVWGYEHIYTSKDPKPAVKAFIEYITGAEYGKRIEELGYGVSSKMQTKEVH